MTYSCYSFGYLTVPPISMVLNTEYVNTEYVLVLYFLFSLYYNDVTQDWFYKEDFPDIEHCADTIMATTTASLEEELQTKNQQVKQYKRQVDAVKADLDKCQTELRIAHQQNTRLQVQ